jgi:hypothetical protein
MKITASIIFTGLLLIASAPRLPAPIIESQEEGTPTPSHIRAKARQTTAGSLKAKTDNGPQRSPSPNERKIGPYAGTWKGVISCGVWGNLEHAIVIDSAQKTMSVAKIGSGAGGANGVAPAVIGANGITATLPGLNGTWCLKPDPDGRSAVVKLTGFMLGSSATFHREQ